MDSITITPDPAMRHAVLRAAGLTCELPGCCAPVECEGHESLAGQDMGATVFCDGTCR